MLIPLLQFANSFINAGLEVGAGEEELVAMLDGIIYTHLQWCASLLKIGDFISYRAWRVTEEINGRGIQVSSGEMAEVINRGAKWSRESPSKIPYSSLDDCIMWAAYGHSQIRYLVAQGETIKGAEAEVLKKIKKRIQWEKELTSAGLDKYVAANLLDIFFEQLPTSVKGPDVQRAISELVKKITTHKETWSLLLIGNAEYDYSHAIAMGYARFRLYRPEKWSEQAVRHSVRLFLRGSTLDQALAQGSNFINRKIDLLVAWRSAGVSEATINNWVKAADRCLQAGDDEGIVDGGIEARGRWYVMLQMAGADASLITETIAKIDKFLPELFGKIYVNEAKAILMIDQIIAQLVQWIGHDGGRVTSSIIEEIFSHVLKWVPDIDILVAGQLASRMCGEKMLAENEEARQKIASSLLSIARSITFGIWAPPAQELAPDLVILNPTANLSLQHQESAQSRDSQPPSLPGAQPSPTLTVAWLNPAQAEHGATNSLF